MIATCESCIWFKPDSDLSSRGDGITDMTGHPVFREGNCERKDRRQWRSDHACSSYRVNCVEQAKSEKQYTMKEAIGMLRITDDMTPQEKMRRYHLSIPLKPGELRELKGTQESDCG